MATIDVFVAGNPKGQPRPRAFARNGTARVYDPGTAEGWKSEVALALRGWANRHFAGPIDVSLTFYFTRPKGHYYTSGEVSKSAPDAYIKKPDADNLAKAVLDAMTGIGFWFDDSQVTTLLVSKCWADRREPRSGARLLILAQESM